VTEVFRAPFGTLGTPLVSIFGKFTHRPQSYTIPLARGSTPLYVIGICVLSIKHWYTPRVVYYFCMMLLMVKEADLDRIDVPGDYEVLDATAVGKRVGVKRDTVLAYHSRRNYARIPRPNRQLAMGPIWYERSVSEWEEKEEGRARGK
jgi:hypothetical protein